MQKRAWSIVAAVCLVALFVTACAELSHDTSTAGMEHPLVRTDMLPLN